MKRVLFKLRSLTVLLALFLVENIRGPPLADAVQPIYDDGVECFTPFLLENIRGPPLADAVQPIYGDGVECFASFLLENIRGPPLADAVQPIHDDGVECFAPFTLVDRGWEGVALPLTELGFFQISESECVAGSRCLPICMSGWMPDPAYIRARADSDPASTHTRADSDPASIHARADSELGSEFPLLAEAPGLETKSAAPPPANRIPYPKRVDVGHVEGKGIGSNVGYSQLAVVFGPEYEVGKFLPLGELRGVVYNDGTVGANAGFIGRFLPESLCQVYGFNLFYDFRQGAHRNHSQLGGGFEVLSKRWEAHTDVGFVAGNNCGHYKKCVFDYPGGFRAVVKRYAVAASFVDARAGYYPVVSDNFQLYVEAGPYYIFGKCVPSTFGAKASIRPQFSNWCSVECSVSHDAIFDTIWQVNVVFSLPLYNFSSLKNKKGPCGVSNRQIYQPIDRDIILLKPRCCWQFNW